MPILGIEHLFALSLRLIWQAFWHRLALSWDSQIDKLRCWVNGEFCWIDRSECEEQTYSSVMLPSRSENRNDCLQASAIAGKCYSRGPYQRVLCRICKLGCKEVVRV